MGFSHPRRVVLLTGNHLCHNPRVLKEATALADSGHQVTVLGAVLDKELKRRDERLWTNARFRFVPVLDLTLGGSRSLLARASVKLASQAGRWTGVENARQLGYAYPFLLRGALREQASLFIAHSEQGMAVAYTLLSRGRRVALDMEDWFSKDCPEEEGRPVELLARLERRLLVKGAFALCPSNAMADALAEAYGCPRPAPVYNAFPWRERAALDGKAKDRAGRTRPSLHWFSQTLGSGRGLEDLMAALPFIPHQAEIHLRGTPAQGFKDRLLAQAPADWRPRIFFHDLVHNDELLSRIAEHDIGIAAERTESLSRDLTIANKLFQYLLGGLAVVASDTRGQREIALGAGEAIRLYRPGDPRSLAEAIDSLLASPEALVRAKEAALAAAETRYCWEAQERRLLEVVEAALKDN